LIAAARSDGKVTLLNESLEKKLEISTSANIALIRLTQNAEMAVTGHYPKVCSANI